VRATERLAHAVLERTVELAEIPAPTHEEGERAQRVADWWRSDRRAGIEIDGAGNVWAQLRGGEGPAILVCAHLDTVFDRTTDHHVRREDGRLVGPSVGDDSLGVAALSALAGLLEPEARYAPVWIVATVGEEGLGNLHGINHALTHPPQPLSGVIAVEGNYLGKVSTVGVGSIRWRVELHGPGGHAWEEPASPSAVHEAASAVHRLGALTVIPGRLSVNVGRIGGGEAINARARVAWFELDLRADDPVVLTALQSRARAVLDRTAAGVDVQINELGRRPAGRIDTSHPLVVAAAQALESIGERARFAATSTDANAALDAGIPAVAIGVTHGAGEHTLAEWIATEPVAAGLTALAETVDRFGDER
jgi:acetylornithine deacetylase/succinyl-diaminopimelate desuccinylase-like protein